MQPMRPAMSNAMAATTTTASDPAELLLCTWERRDEADDAAREGAVTAGASAHVGVGGVQQDGKGDAVHVGLRGPHLPTGAVCCQCSQQIQRGPHLPTGAALRQGSEGARTGRQRRATGRRTRTRSAASPRGDTEELRGTMAVTELKA
eukprot:1242818-Alexandrium_andersonii.AAC.1